MASFRSFGDKSVRSSVSFRQAPAELREGQEKIVFTGNLAGQDSEKIMSGAKVTVVKDFAIEDGELVSAAPSSPLRMPGAAAPVDADRGASTAVSIVQTEADLQPDKHADHHPWNLAAIIRTVIMGVIVVGLIIMYASIPDEWGGEQAEEPFGAVHHTLAQGEGLSVALPPGPTAYVLLDTWLPRICASAGHGADGAGHGDDAGRTAHGAEEPAAVNGTETPWEWTRCGGDRGSIWVWVEACHGAGCAAFRAHAEHGGGGHRDRAADVLEEHDAGAVAPPAPFEWKATGGRKCYKLSNSTLDRHRPPVRLDGDTDAEALRLVWSTDSRQGPCDRVLFGHAPNGIAISYTAIGQGAAAPFEPLFALIVLLFVYALIISEIIHRTVVAMVGSFMALTVLAAVRERIPMEEVVQWIDLETVCLLFGMMIMVCIASKTGFFEYSAVKALKMSKGNIWLLTVLLCLFTAIVSAFLDNVTTMLLVVPVTIRLAAMLKVDPRPMLLAQVTMSNVGGTATPIGDPPNIIIINDRGVKEADITFGSFTVHMGLGVIFVMVTTLIQLRIMLAKDKNIFPRGTAGAGQRLPNFRSLSGMANWMKADWDEDVDQMMELKDEFDDGPRPGASELQESGISGDSSFSRPSAAPVVSDDGSAHSLDSMRAPQGAVKVTEKFVFYQKTDSGVTFVTPHCKFTVSGFNHICDARGQAVLNAMAVAVSEFEAKAASVDEEAEAACDDEHHADGKMEVTTTSSGGIDYDMLEKQYCISNWPLFVNVCLVLLSVVAMFFLHSAVPAIHLTLAWTSLVGAMALLLLSNLHDFDAILEHVEWSTLLFFAALFVLMEALKELGLISLIGQGVSSAIASAPDSSRLLLGLLIVLWVSAFASAFIDNIPYTLALIPIVSQVASETGLPLRPLVWALAFGACMGGNGTLIGASANVVTSGLANGFGWNISFNMFFKMGTCVV